MSILIDDLKRAYNVLIAREHKAEKYLENDKVPQETRDKWLPEFEKITILLSALMRRYKVLTGHEMEISEVLNGFS